MKNPISKFIVLGAAAAAAALMAAAPSYASTAGLHPQVGAKAASASTGSTLTPLVQEFRVNTSPFCPAGSGNVPCDGAVGDYGTITRVASGTNSVTAPAGLPYYAETAGSQATSTGCPSGTSEYCTGPYALFDGGGVATFPSTGFTVTTDLYLTPTEPGDITADIGLNNSDGAYGNDIFINFCPVTGGGLAVSAGTMESCDGATTAQITSAGWYRLVWDFTPDAGTIALNQSVSSEATGYAVWSGELDAPVTVNGVPATPSNAGGPGYFWIPTENVASLPLSNFAVQIGSHPGGTAPDQVTVTTPDARVSKKTGAKVRFRVHATSAARAAITGWKLSARNLDGLRISRSGLITGKVTKKVSETVTVTATDANGVTGTVSFRLVVR
ncbi:MAG TPA: putative Ig domain-containing protein [Streptosporangiaceae bacterium]|nr:putative Ig domain-containing protein [Streptosporangiaceae bacterium]